MTTSPSSANAVTRFAPSRSPRKTPAPRSPSSALSPNRPPRPPRRRLQPSNNPGSFSQLDTAFSFAAWRGTCPDPVGIAPVLFSLSSNFQLSIEDPEPLGAVDFQPSYPLRHRSRLIEREGNKQQLLVALDLQSNRRSWRQGFERTTQPLQRGQGLAIQRANHVSGVQRHFHASARRASGNDNPKRVAQICNHRGDLLVNLQPKNPERRHKIFLCVGQPGDLVHIARRLHHRDVENQPVIST